VARILTGLFGSSQQTSPPATALRVNTSLQGVPIALVLGGANRLAGNLIDYYGFFYQNAPAAAGGKGGIGGGGSKGQSGNYNYFTSFIIGLCEGPIHQLNSFWIGGTSTNVPGVGTPTGDTGFWNNAFFISELFVGDYAQTPWAYTEANDPSHAIAYRGIAYVGFENFPLGSSASLPNFTFEVVSTNSFNVVPGQPDGDASIALTDYLTNQFYGLGFPSARLGSLAQWQSYCIALGFAVSPVLASSTAASSLVNDLTDATNSAPCWQDGQFTVVPYGDAAVTAGEIQTITETHEVPANQIGVDVNNVPLDFPSIQVSFFATFATDAGVTYSSGVPLTRVFSYIPTGYPTSGSPLQGEYYEQGGTYYFSPADINAEVLISYNYAATASYQPNTTPLYDFTIDDFLVNQGTIGTGLAVNNSPVIVVRTSRDQMLNDIKVEYLDRTNTYNPVDIEIKDEASIVAFGRLRPSDIKQFHFFCLAGAAQQSATLQLIRQQIARTFQFTVGRHFMLILELMALVTVTDPGQGLDEQPVRIIEIQENEDFSITVTCEEYLGTVSAPAYGIQPSQGSGINYNVDPGSVNAPIIFEPTDELNNTNSLGSLQIWCPISGQDTAVWGGCFVWVSYDAENYSRLPNPIVGASRMGVTTADLPVVGVNPTGQTIDATNTLAVNLSESAGTLSSATQADALALNTASYVGGEIVSYAAATLTAPNQYNLSYMVRGAYGTESDIIDHPAGTPFARLDDSVFAFAYDQSRIGSTIYLKFQSFNIYQGGQQSLADCEAYSYNITGVALTSPLPIVANPRTVFTAGFQQIWWDAVSDFRSGIRYLVKKGATYASAQTVGDVAHPPLTAYGDATYWIEAYCQPVAGLLVYSETPTSITIAGSMLSQNVVESINFASLGWAGTFTGVGKEGADPTAVLRLTGAGNILADTNVLTDPDVLNEGGILSSGTWTSSTIINTGYVGTCSVNVGWLSTGLPVGQNVLTIADFLNAPDILASASTAFITVTIQIRTATTASLGVPNWGSWQTFVPGVYNAQYLQFQATFTSVSPQVIAYLLSMTAEVSVPARIDHYIGNNVTTAGKTIVFQPDNATTPQPFNGGPLQSATNTPLPEVQMSWSGNADANYVIDSISLSQMTFHFINSLGGTIEVDGVTVVVEGY
jgi:Putative phage tail protein